MNLKDTNNVLISLHRSLDTHLQMTLINYFSFIYRPNLPGGFCVYYCLWRCDVSMKNVAVRNKGPTRTWFPACEVQYAKKPLREYRESKDPRE